MSSLQTTAPSTFAKREMVIAQQAIQLPEVQAMIRELAKYNLGVNIPHSHDHEGNFLALPPGMAQVERDGKDVTFESVDSVSRLNPVGWRWVDGQDGVGAVQFCSCCSWHTNGCNG